MGESSYELVVRWSTKSGGIGRLLAMNSYPLARTPRQVDLHAAKVWVASGPEIVAQFRSRGWSSGSTVKLLDGTARSGGGAGRLQIQPGTAKVLRKPIPMARIPGGSANPFGHKDAIRYLQARPRRFVVITTTPKRVTETALPISTKEAWLQTTRDQARHTVEGLKHATEVALVIAYSDYRNARTNRPIIRHRIEVSGADLFSDAFDHDKNLLIEAKGDTSRPAIRMAIGQLLDYRYAMRPKRPGIAILVPQMPSDDMLELASSLGIGVIWRQGGAFYDSHGGTLVN